MELTVKPIKENKKGEGLAAIDPKVANELEIEEGDYVYIKGPDGNETGARCSTGYSDDRGQNIIRIDNNTRQEIGVEIDDSVEIEKGSFPPAETVNLVSPNFSFTMEEQAELTRGLVGYVVIEGETIDVNRIVGLPSEKPAQVENTNPSGPVEITKDTEISLEEDKDVFELNRDPPPRHAFDQLVQRAESKLLEIDEKSAEIEDRLENIEKSQSNIENLEATAQSLLEKTTSSALGEQFADRKSELEKSLVYWKYSSIVTISLLIIFSAIIYSDITTSSEGALTSISKLSLLLPVSVAVWFTVSNYSRQKRLMEEYEFKSRMALSLSGFREVLRAEMPEEQQEEVGQFVMNTMDKIYSNPQQNIDSGESTQSNNEPLPSSQRPLVELIKKFGRQ